MSWRELHKRFDPILPIRAADHQSWRAERTAGPASAIVGTLSNVEGISGTRWLLMGTVGTGKTTELFRVAEQRASRDFVVVLDLADHFDRVVGDAEGLQHLEPWEVVFLAALALLRAAQEQLGEMFEPEREELRRAWSSATGAAQQGGAPRTTTIDIAKLIGSIAVALSTAVGGPSLAPLASLSGAVWNAPIGIKRQRLLVDQDEEAKSMLSCFNRIAGGIQSKSKRVLLIIDGLDRIREHAHATRLFVESSLLARMDTSLVVTAPMGFRHSLTPRGIQHDLTPITLENEPVLDRTYPEDPNTPGPGIPFFIDLFQRRVQDLNDVPLHPDHVRRLAYYGGGRAREFVRLVRDVALQHLIANAAKSDSAIIDAVLRQHRLDIEQGLHTGHVRLLKSVISDPMHTCPEGDLVWELLRSEVLLPYPDGSPWYFPHPLLLLGKFLQ